MGYRIYQKGIETSATICIRKTERDKKCQLRSTAVKEGTVI
jgi:hypothetical protein